MKCLTFRSDKNHENDNIYKIEGISIVWLYLRRSITAWFKWHRIIWSWTFGCRQFYWAQLLSLLERWCIVGKGISPGRRRYHSYVGRAPRLHYRIWPAHQFPFIWKKWICFSSAFDLLYSSLLLGTATWLWRWEQQQIQSNDRSGMYELSQCIAQYE